MIAMADDEPTNVATEDRHAALIEKWFIEHFHGSPHMRDTEAFNHVRAAVDDLKRRITENGQ